MNRRKILIPIDLSDSSRRSIDYALGLQRKGDAEIIVCYVVDSHELIGFGYEVDELMVTFSPESRREHETAFRNFLRPYVVHGNIHGELAVGQPYNSIMKHAGTLDPDLIVLSLDNKWAKSWSSTGLLKDLAEQSRWPILLLGPDAFPKTAGAEPIAA